jgi:hypothetical protein
MAFSLIHLGKKKLLPVLGQKSLAHHGSMSGSGGLHRLCYLKNNRFYKKVNNLMDFVSLVPIFFRERYLEKQEATSPLRFFCGKPEP